MAWLYRVFAAQDVCDLLQTVVLGRIVNFTEQNPAKELKHFPFLACLLTEAFPVHAILSDCANEFLLVIKCHDVHLGQRSVRLKCLLDEVLVLHSPIRKRYRLVIEVVSVLCDLPTSFRTHFLRNFCVVLAVDAGGLDHFFAITDSPARATADLALIFLELKLSLTF